MQTQIFHSLILFIAPFLIFYLYLQHSGTYITSKKYFQIMVCDAMCDQHQLVIFFKILIILTDFQITRELMHGYSNRHFDVRVQVVRVNSRRTPMRTSPMRSEPEVVCAPFHKSFKKQVGFNFSFERRTTLSNCFFK